MIPPESSCNADIHFDCTDEELFMALERIMTGSPLPSNVIDYLNPYKYRPTYLPEGVWYLINSKENTDTECGFWRTKGEACEVFSNSAIIGWRTTLQYYDGQVPQECKTDWLMQVFSITQKKLCENSMAKEATMLCRVFLDDEKGTDQNLRPKMSFTDITTAKQNNSIEQLLQRGGSNKNVGSTSEPKVNKDDEIRALAVTERLTDQHIENPPEPDYISREDYLELRDLDNPASPSSSSENSSCLTMSSDECFDSLALLQDLEPETDQVLEQRNAGYAFTVSVSCRPNEVVMLPATSGSVDVRSNLGTIEIPKTHSPVPISAIENRDPDNKAAKIPVRNQKRDRQGEGSSASAPYNSSTPTSSHNAITDGQKKGPMGRMKRLKNFFCFRPF